MNKQEVIDKLKAAIPDPALDDYQRVEEVALTYALELVEELGKVTVPQFVADWYEEHKDNFEYSVQCLCVQGCKPVRQIDIWFDNDDNKPIETLVMMHKFGYEVDMEGGGVMFELYFKINYNEPELQSVFDTKAEAEKHMQRLIDSKSRIKSLYIREIQHDGYWLYDYGAHNAFYMVKEVEECNQKH